MTKGYGFRVALTKTRMYYDNRRRDNRTKRRKLRRASARVIRLVQDLGQAAWEYRATNYALSVVSGLNITNTPPAANLISSPVGAGSDIREASRD